jgi:hypothetical protein
MHITLISDEFLLQALTKPEGFFMTRGCYELLEMVNSGNDEKTISK